MIQLARTHGIEPIVATEITVRPRLALIDDLKAFVGRVIGRQSYHDYINREVLDLNRWLREYAACEGVLLLDIQPMLSDASGKRRRAYAAPDGSHISQAGYDALARYVGVVLERRVTPR
jgi:lysophospholipase L1-like esterase